MIAHISDDGLAREESVAEHTEKTAFLCGVKGERCGISQLMTLCAVLHDMGKNKDAFHAYLHADEKTRQKLRGTVAHASTGAKYIYDLYHDCSGSIKYMVEMISYAVAAHHGVFDCVNIEHEDIFLRKLKEVDDYDEACSNSRRDYLDACELDKIFTEAQGEFTVVWNRIKGLFTEIKPTLVSRHNEKAREMLADCKLFMLSALQRLILSVLIDSDWEATSDFMSGVDTLSKQSGFDVKAVFKEAGDNFASYMLEKKQSARDFPLTDKEELIMSARDALQEECRRFAEYPAGIYCLPIPTGGGKTLASLAYALEFCRRHPETERIIYVSPYISITEQNAQVFREAIGNDEWILEHHSSVVRNTEVQGEDYQNYRCSRFDINWDEPFICTTFVQFMNTLFSDKSESVRRMHRLVNSVVIIDEVQSMPLKCVNTFNYMINFLNAVCNTNIVLCTATQPTLEEAGCPIRYSNPKYMIKDAGRWFYRFERVKIYASGINQAYRLEGLCEEIAGQMEHCRSILVVLNTKSAVRTLYDLLRERGHRAVYLTTNLCAEHRSDKIKEIKKILAQKQEKIVVVSTNLIEAGVDISFECVYRSMAGLDSVAQTAGRCNRNGEMECGNIYLIRVEDENSGTMEELQQNCRAAEHVIFQYHNSSEQDSLLMPVWMDKYYKEVYAGASDKMNFPIEKLDTNIMELLSGGFGCEDRKNYMNQAYKTAGRAYRVIDDQSFGVIVPYGRGAEIIESIQEASDLTDIRYCIRRAQRYTVNIRENLLRKFKGLIQPICSDIPDLYMVAAPGAYSSEYGITPEWETLIF